MGAFAGYDFGFTGTDTVVGGAEYIRFSKSTFSISFFNSLDSEEAGEEGVSSSLSELVSWMTGSGSGSGMRAGVMLTARVIMLVRRSKLVAAGAAISSFSSFYSSYLIDPEIVVVVVIYLTTSTFKLSTGKAALAFLMRPSNPNYETVGYLSGAGKALLCIVSGTGFDSASSAVDNIPTNLSPRSSRIFFFLGMMGKASVRARAAIALSYCCCGVMLETLSRVWIRFSYFSFSQSISSFQRSG